MSLLAFVGSLVDMMRAALARGLLRTNHGRILLWMAFVAVIARPLVSTAHDLIKNQIIAGPVTTAHALADAPLRAAPEPGLLPERLRRPHRHQGDADRAWRVRESVMQLIEAIWSTSAVYFVGAVVIFAAADRRLLVPLAGLARALYRRAALLRAAAGQRSTAAGRCALADDRPHHRRYTNIATVKLFAHADREDGYARAAMQEFTRHRARADAPGHASSSRATTRSRLLLIVAARRLALWLWSAGHA